MKKIYASLMVLILLFSVMPAFAAEHSIEVRADGSAVAFPEVQPLEQDGVVMLPVLFVVEHLGGKVTWNDETREVYIVNGTDHIVFKPGEDSGAVNGTVKSFGKQSFIKENRTYVPLSFFSDLAGYTVEYNPETNAVIITSPTPIPGEVTDIIELMAAGHFQELIDTYFDQHMKNAIDAAALKQLWDGVTGNSINYTGIALLESSHQGPYEVIKVSVQYDKIGFDVTIAFDGQRLAAGLLISNAYAIEDIPAGIEEVEVIVGKGTPYELHGTLTLPLNQQSPLPAVVLVHGSGPSDRDESAGGYKPFKDIAWGLAQQGIASVRYEKRTYAHAAKLAEQDVMSFTVKEEAIEDAILAAELLKNDPRIEPSQVYLIGHSQGGMLAPRIEAQGGDFAGVIILAGSPRTLWELIYDQNMYFMDILELSEVEVIQVNEYIEAEMKKARSLEEMSDEEAMAITVFGFPGYYLKEMDSHSARIYAPVLQKPLFILQGEDDFQVYADIDFIEWQELLQNKENVDYKLYPGLNHFFIEYEGEGKRTLDEYQYPNKVDQGVIDDIANWIHQLSK